MTKVPSPAAQRAAGEGQGEGERSLIRALANKEEACIYSERIQLTGIKGKRELTINTRTYKKEN
ncbi:MAG: hypothetical protein AB9891_01360 [Anaerolineaceae bacterium]